MNKRNSLSFSTPVTQLSTYKYFLHFSVVLLVYSVVSSDPSLYFFRGKSITAPNKNGLLFTPNATHACRKIFRCPSLLTHKNLKKSRSSSHRLICKNSFLIFAMIPIRWSRKRSNRASVISIEFKPSLNTDSEKAGHVLWPRLQTRVSSWLCHFPSQRAYEVNSAPHPTSALVSLQ